MKPKYIVGTVVILIFIFFASMSFQNSLVAYVSFDEAKANNRTVQVKGKRVVDSEHYDSDAKTFNFRIINDSGEEFRVIYHGVKPSNFEEAKEVVAKGRYVNGVFMADDILVKCPSKYEAEGFEGVSS